MSIEEVPNLLANLMKTTNRLQDLFNRPFTPDGHLVGSTGEVLAAYIYGLHLRSCSTPQVDAITEDGRTVQIKLTGRDKYGFRWSNMTMPEPADLLIALQMTNGANFIEVYNGTFPTDLLLNRRDSTNGQLSISVSTLIKMNQRSLPQIRSLNDFNKLFSVR